MRPLMLSMSAFGPYAATQVLDFGELKGRSFFLIHGPTGSGKTTILDAICFALYGDTSSAQRDGKSMRSDHADAAACTEVVFDFSIGADVYRVHRIPEQERRKKRGEGTTIKAAEAALWKKPAPEQEWELAVSGWSKVTEKVETLLGFQSSQFRQVVLLPQGDFRKLLMADSRERQEIMQALFKTDLYQAVEDTLKAKAQEFKHKYEELDKDRSWVLRDAAVQSADELYARCKEHTTALVDMNAHWEVLQEQLRTAEGAFTQGIRMQDKLTEREHAHNMLAEMVNKVPLVEEKRKEWTRAKRAAGMSDAEKALQQLEQDVLAVDKSCKDYKTQLAKAQERREEAQIAWELEQSKEAERSELTRQMILLRELAGKAEALGKATETLQIAATDKEHRLREKQNAALTRKELQDATQAATHEYQQYQRLTQEAHARKAHWERWQDVIFKRTGLEEARSALHKAEELLQQVVEMERQTEMEYAAAKAILGELQECWAKGQAALMAASLADGAPCPVCGSLEHPVKSVGASRIPSETQIKEQQYTVDRMDGERTNSYAKRNRCQTERDILVHKVHDWEAQLGEYADSPYTDLAAAIAQAEAQYQLAVEAEQRTAAIEVQLTKAKEMEQTLAEQGELLEELARAAESAYQAAEAVVRERSAAIPEEYRDAVQLLHAQRTTQQRLIELKECLEKRQQNVDEANRFCSSSQAALEHAVNTYTNMQQRLLRERETFLQRLQETGFADTEEYTQAKRAVEHLRRLEEGIISFDGDLHAAKERVIRAEEAALGLVLPDLHGLQAALNLLRQQNDGALTAKANLAAAVERETAWLKRIESLQQALGDVEGRYGIVGRLAEVANGRNEYGLTFQRFVLGALLDDVAVAANERLKMMSRGRYYLQRTMDRARKNAAGGLDLEVFDNYTGIARGVSTLSGGETFLASLSLALGLADVVQAYAGGVHLDTMFVDEGFGTLDPESLDFALNALIDLQQGGRLVGIISHVPELKERIDARLEISASERGSVACFKVAL
jgi:DNA repair protein SbcC/Rad50